MTAPTFPPGTLVRARGRDWLVIPGGTDGMLRARPLGGSDAETTLLLAEFDDPTPAVFAPPTVDDRGDASRARLLRDGLRLSFQATGGPFRSFAKIAVTPRNYQLVPLMMATAQDTTRLLIADGVGIGKTVEAGLIVAELLATGDAERLAVLCSPQLAPQWRAELQTKFGIDAQLLLPSTVNRLQRSVPFGSTIYQHYPYLVISTDFIKQHSRRDEFAVHCPELVIVDEAHTCVGASSTAKHSQAQLRYTLLRKLADDPTRHLLLLTATPHSGDDEAWQSLIGLLDPRLTELPADLSGRDREEDRKLLAQFMIQRQRADIREYLDEDTPFPDRESTETSYTLTPAYKDLFDDVMAFVRKEVDDPRLSTVHRRVRWWSAIALLRCLASSPAAAEQTLLNRSALAIDDSTHAIDALAEPRILDTDLDDTTEGGDTAFGWDTDELGTPTTATQRRLRQLASAAAALKGPGSDAKLKKLIPLLQKLLAEGYHPIVFCRYIPTADYLAEHLTAALTKKSPGLRVEAVDRHPAARRAGTARHQPHRPRRAAAADRHRLPLRRHQPAGRVHCGRALRPGLESDPPRAARRPGRPVRPTRPHRAHRHLLRRRQRHRRHRARRPHPPPRQDPPHHRGFRARPGGLHHRDESDLGVPAAARQDRRPTRTRPRGRHLARPGRSRRGGLGQRGRTGESLPLPLPAGRHQTRRRLRAARRHPRLAGRAGRRRNLHPHRTSPAGRHDRRHRRRVQRPYRHPAA